MSEPKITIPAKTLNQLQIEIGRWGEVTFPGADERSIAAHFEEEAGEFVADVLAGKVSAFQEAADCAILLMQFCHKAGVELQWLVEAKMIVNRGRTWEEVPAGYSKHVEEPS